MKDVKDIFERNWGRWGPDDERGVLNLVDADYIRELLAQPLTGRIYTLGVEVGSRSPSFGRPSPIHLMGVDGADFAALDQLSGFGFADDTIVMATHSSTHLDALAHVLHSGHMYNGFSWREVRSSGAARCGIENVGAIVCRAHLFDFASELGVDLLADDFAIGPDELEALRARKDLELRPGDAVLVRTGFIKTLAAEPRRVGPEPGLTADCAEWIADHDLVIVGADNSAVERLETSQKGAPLHERLVCGVGCYLLELLDLELLASEGAKDGVLIVCPLKIRRGVGSPVNPILIT
jgi:kynurenine formamidase